VGLTVEKNVEYYIDVHQDPLHRCFSLKCLR
jgi:hypothetical protein